VKGIIFDLYNTLVYTTVKKSPYMDFFRSLNLTKEETSYWIDRVLTNNYTFEKLVKEITPPHLPTPYFKNYIYDIKDELKNTHVFDDTYAVLETLSKKYRIFLLSNISTPYTDSYYNLKLDKWVEYPFFSCDLGFRKPQPEAFSKVVRYSRMNVNDLIMIGDSKRSDYEGAMNFGIKAIHKTGTLSDAIKLL